MRTQRWIAASVYCLLAIICKKVDADRKLHEIQEILGVSIFQKTLILRAFSRTGTNLVEYDLPKQS